MADLLVRLYDLPACPQRDDVTVRHAMAYEKRAVLNWVTEHFGAGWASECDAAFSRLPVSCFLATSGGEILGFACYEATARGFFGPIGVQKDCRGRDLGRALVLACLHAMRSLGYAYAVIGGGSGKVDFYAKCAEVLPIPGSEPGVYRDMLANAREEIRSIS